MRKLEEEWKKVNEELKSITEEGKELDGQQQAICNELKQKKNVYREKQVLLKLYLKMYHSFIYLVI